MENHQELEPIYHKWLNDIDMLKATILPLLSLSGQLNFANTSKYYRSTLLGTILQSHRKTHRHFLERWLHEHTINDSMRDRINFNIHRLPFNYRTNDSSALVVLLTIKKFIYGDTYKPEIVNQILLLLMYPRTRFETLRYLIPYSFSYEERLFWQCQFLDVVKKNMFPTDDRCTHSKYLMAMSHWLSQSVQCYDKNHSSRIFMDLLGFKFESLSLYSIPPFLNESKNEVLTVLSQLTKAMSVKKSIESRDIQAEINRLRSYVGSLNSLILSMTPSDRTFYAMQLVDLSKFVLTWKFGLSDLDFFPEFVDQLCLGLSSIIPVLGSENKKLCKDSYRKLVEMELSCDLRAEPNLWSGDRKSLASRDRMGDALDIVSLFLERINVIKERKGRDDLQSNPIYDDLSLYNKLINDDFDIKENTVFEDLKKNSSKNIKQSLIALCWSVIEAEQDIGILKTELSYLLKLLRYMNFAQKQMVIAKLVEFVNSKSELILDALDCLAELITVAPSDVKRSFVRNCCEFLGDCREDLESSTLLVKATQCLTDAYSFLDVEDQEKLFYFMWDEGCSDTIRELLYDNIFYAVDWGVILKKMTIHQRQTLINRLVELITKMADKYKAIPLKCLSHLSDVASESVNKWLLECCVSILKSDVNYVIDEWDLLVGCIVSVYPFLHADVKLELFGRIVDPLDSPFSAHMNDVLFLNLFHQVIHGDTVKFFENHEPQKMEVFISRRINLSEQICSILNTSLKNALSFLADLRSEDETRVENSLFKHVISDHGDFVGFAKKLNEIFKLLTSELPSYRSGFFSAMPPSEYLSGQCITLRRCAIKAFQTMIQTVPNRTDQLTIVNWLVNEPIFSGLCNKSFVPMPVAMVEHEKINAAKMSHPFS